MDLKEEKILIDKISELIASANSYKRIYEYVSKIPRYEEISEKLLSDNCQSQASMVIAVIEDLEEQIKELKNDVRNYEILLEE